MKGNRVWFATLVPVALIAVVVTALAVQAASPGATIKPASNATLANPPTSVIVTVDYSCLPSQFSFGSVDVDQSQIVGGASGSRIDVFGFGEFQPVCDDRARKQDVVVTAEGFYGPSTFEAGSAGASAFVASGAAFANAQVELNIK